MTCERSALHEEVVAELGNDVVDDAIVGGGRRAQHRCVVGKGVEDVNNSAIVRAKIVAPIADAVRFVDHE